MAIKPTPNDVAAAAEPPSKKPISLSAVSYLRGFLRRFGLITGASDDDPSAIATFAQIGAQFGFAMLWTLLFSHPLMVQEQKVSPGERPLKRAPEQASFQLQPMRADTRLGMAISNIVAFFIMLDAASALHARGVANIQTVGQAAAGLRPAGRQQSCRPCHS
ncbi:MAG: divalent metal cation transporter [Candidatus Binataceae bacterium]